MKKYLPYIIAAAIILIAAGAYYANSSKKAKNSNVSVEGDMASMDHGAMGDTPIQSHRSYTVQITSDTSNIKPGQATKITYKIVNEKKEVLKDFAVAHEKLMHFILVRKDLQQFQHLHPDFNQQTGEFSINITFPTDGPYRLFPDFTPTPENPQKLPVTVTYDVNVGDLGKYKPQAVNTDTNSTKTVDGYTVYYDFPETIKAQTQIDYDLSVEKDNSYVNLEQYLGAMGHGVIIKEGNLDFIHTHAGEMDMAGMDNMGTDSMGQMNHGGEPNVIDFSTSFPEPGTYRIFTQFQVKGKVITTDYAVRAQ